MLVLTPLYLLIRFAICLIMPKEKPRREWTLDDVWAALEQKAKERGETLNYRLSIVDLCRVLDLSPTLAARRDMYEKAGGEGEYTGTAQQNIWLHAQVMDALVKQRFGDE
jgi:hypothetical protein